MLILITYLLLSASHDHKNHAFAVFTVDWRIEIKNVACQKLTPTLHYCLHYENIKQCLIVGVIHEETNRVLEFEQSPRLRKYIDFNVDHRKNATSKGQAIIVRPTCQEFKMINDDLVIM